MEHAANAPAWAVALMESGLGLAIRHSLWIYPLANVLHVIGVVLLVGPILALDLRFLGFARYVPIKAASRMLTPFAIVGICLIVPTGLTLFAADAGPLAGNRLLQIKLSLVALGLVNAVAFRLLWTRRISRWDTQPPALGRAQVMASIAIWLSVPTLGRLLAYL
jgi:hypothetical protein